MSTNRNCLVSYLKKAYQTHKSNLPTSFLGSLGGTIDLNLKSITGQTPGPLIQDGEARIQVLSLLISKIAMQTDVTVNSLQSRIEKLNRKLKAEVNSFNKNCEKLRKQYLDEADKLDEQEDERINELYEAYWFQLSVDSNFHTTKINRINASRSETEDFQYAAVFFKKLVVTRCEKKISELKNLMSRIILPASTSLH